MSFFKISNAAVGEIFAQVKKSKLIISNFTIPSKSNYGIFETKSEFGLQKMIYSLNQNLQDAGFME